MSSTLSRLQQWYAQQCNGDWEHEFGVHIGTLDNPGWHVRIKLADTNLEGRPFAAVHENVGPLSNPQSTSWLSCEVGDKVWVGAGDERKLERMLQIFLDWASTQGTQNR